MAESTTTVQILLNLKDNATKGLAVAGNSLTMFSKKIEESSRGLTALAAGFGVFGGAIVAGSLSAVKASSDLNEALNANNVIFGTAADKMLEFAESAYKIGMSTTQALQASTGFGQSLQNIGASAEEAQAMTEAFLTRAADVASVMNLPIEEALQRFSAGLRGESNAVERFAVITEGAMQAWAAQNNIIDSTSQRMTEAQKVLVRYNMIMEQTDRMAGDFANTSDGLANRQRILAAQFENLKAKIGNALTPVLEKVLGKIIEVTTAVTNWINKNPELAAKITVVVAAVGVASVVIAGLLALLMAIPAIVEGASLVFAAPVAIAIAAILAIVAALVYVRNHWAGAWEKIKSITADAINWIVFTPFTILIKAFNSIMEAIGSDFRIAMPTELIGEAFSMLADKVKETGGEMLDTATNALGLDTIMKNLKNTFVSGGTGEAAKKLADDVSNAFESMKGKASELSQNINDSMDESIKKMKELNASLEEVFKGAAESQLSSDQDFASKYVDQEQTLADLRSQIAQERDQEKRRELQEELDRQQKAYDDAYTFELSHINIVAEARRVARLTELERAGEEYSKKAILLGQEVEMKANKIKAEIQAEINKQEELKKINAEAAKSTAEFLASDVNMTKQAIDKQIEYYNQLAKAVQNAKSGQMSAMTSKTPFEFKQFAKGGNVAGGEPIIVGEEGAELFVPNTDGRIIPNRSTSGVGLSSSITVNVNGGNYLSQDAAEMFGDILLEKLQLQMRT